MSKTKLEENAAIEPAEPAEDGRGTDETARRVAQQAWISLAFWFAFGLFLEGLIGFRSPAYLQDPVRRELFRLAHTHGTVLGLFLLIVGLYLRKNLVALPKLVVRAVQLGVVLMPLGFLLGGVKHTETDPNALVFLVPVGGLLIIFGIVALALASFKKPD
ncbi:MAG: hypothetical protein JSS81_20620 [Acidobacteria bacterium]|nr:hypothetical protein [Acidobacteriota bacterium]